MTDHFSMKQENSEMEEMSARGHVEIKKEPQEFKDLSEPRNPDLGNDDFKEEISDPENKIDKSENLDIEEDKPLRKKRHKKKSRKVLQPFPEPPDGLVENYYDLDLSVEFLSQLFKYVNELCEYINNGDQNGNRSSVVIQNLNYAVSCYRVNLPNPDEVIKDSAEDQENFKYEMDLPDFLENDDGDYIPKKKKTKKIKKAEQKSESIGEFGEGPKKRKRKKLHEMDNEPLFAFIKCENDSFQCAVCNYVTPLKPNLFRHIRMNHQTELKTKSDNDNGLVPERKNDCETNVCIRLYGPNYRKLWCKNCDDNFQKKVELEKSIRQLKREQDPNPNKNRATKCIPCDVTFEERKDYNIHISEVHDGKKAFQCLLCTTTCTLEAELKRHIANVHEGIKPFECNVCNKRFGRRGALNIHKDRIHEGNKSCLCTECGARFSTKDALKRHFEGIHEKKRPFVCSLCNADFALKQTLTTHIMGVHEGKKPHLCSLCGVSFVLKGKLTKHIAVVHNGIKPIKRQRKPKKSQLPIEGEFDPSSQRLPQHEKKTKPQFIEREYDLSQRFPQHERPAYPRDQNP